MKRVFCSSYEHPHHNRSSALPVWSDHVGHLNGPISCHVPETNSTLFGALKDFALSSSSIDIKKKRRDRLWPRSDAVVQQWYLRTLWHTNDTGKHTPHDATTSWYRWHQDKAMLFTQKNCPAISVCNRNQDLPDQEVFFHSTIAHFCRSRPTVVRSFSSQMTVVEPCMVLGFWYSFAQKVQWVVFVVCYMFVKGSTTFENWRLILLSIDKLFLY